MKITASSAVLALLGIVTLPALAEDVVGAGANLSASQASTPDDRAIRELVVAFTRAFDAGDAASVAALYTSDARMVDTHGEVVEGRAAIEEEYASLFRENPGLKIEVRTDSIRFITPDSAIEEGMSRVIPRGPKPSVVNRFTVVYARRDGRWLQASVHEAPGGSPTPHERLASLAWMLGDWVEEASDSRTSSAIHWTEDENYLVRDFVVKVGSRTALSGTQRIGWDARAGQVKSWIFNSDGSHGEGFWSRQGDAWVIKASGVLPDGRATTATHILTPLGPESCRWHTADRTVGGEVIPGTHEFVMVRRPPTPRLK